MSDQHCSEDELRARDIPSFIEPRPPLILHPSLRPRPQKGTNLLELFEEDMESEETELLQVYLRLKPCKEINELYEVRSDKCFITSMDTTTAGHGRRTQQNISKMYTFSQIFGPDSSQNEVFEAVVKYNLKKLPEGQSFTLLTYGASGSGKTYTLMGTVGSPGLIPRSLEYVFKLIDASQQPLYKPTEGGGKRLSNAEQEFELQWVKKLRQTSMPLHDKYRRMSSHLNNYMSVSSLDLANRRRHYVWVSFVEIYNEAIYDLLSPPEKRTKLRIREDPSGTVYVKGANQAFVRSGEEAYDVLVAGKHNLVVASTGIHAQSSRSHCIFTITMLTETENGIRSSCVRLCDLAGCERARATGNTGARMAESRAINSSLHVLERCLQALHRLQKLRQRQNHRSDPVVPYRESKLTRLLGPGLSGSQGEAVSMVVTLNPALRYASETKHVLSLAAVAQDIQLSNTVLTSTFGSCTTQEDSTFDNSAEVMRLRSENERLHYELALAHSRNDDLKVSFEEYQQKMSKTMSELVEETKDIARFQYEAQIKSLKDEMNDMVEEYESRLTATIAQVPSTDMAQRCWQSKITELMSKIADLEENLTAERLARSRAENEVEYLRNCIDERDEVAYRYNGLGNQNDVVTLSDSEHEWEDVTDDPLHESLEPVFKIRKNLNKTQEKAKNENVQKSINDDFIVNENDNSSETNESDLQEVVAIDYTSDDDKNCIMNCFHQSSSGNIIQNITEIKDQPYMKRNQKQIKEKLLFEVENYVSQARKYSEDEISKSYEVDDEKLKKLNLQRGSFCLATNKALPEDSFDAKVKENLENSVEVSLNKDKMDDCKPILQLSEDSFNVKVKENLENSAHDFSLDKNKVNYCKPTSEDYFDRNANENLENRADNFSVDKDETRVNYNKPTIELHKDSSNVKVKENLQNITDNYSMDEDEIQLNYIKPIIELPKDCSNVKLKEKLQKIADNYRVDKDEIKFKYIKPAIELPKDSSDVKRKENLQTFADNIGVDKDKINMNNIKQTTSKSKTETVNTLIQTFKTKQCRDNSLSQFEQLENATKSSHNDDSEEKVENFGEIKMHKKRKNYFGDSLNLNSNKVIHNIKLFNEICKPLENKITSQDPNQFLKIKRIYFDNNDASAQTAKNKIITETTSDNVIENSASTRKDVNNDSEPRLNIKPFGEAVTKPFDNFDSITKNPNVLLNDSLSFFDEPESPITVQPINTMSNVESAQKSIEKLVLNQNSNRLLKSEVKSDIVTSDEKYKNKPSVVTEYEVEPANLIVPQPDKEIFSNTIEEFDNIYKTTSPRVTEFDLIFSNETAATIKIEKDNHKDTQIKPVQKDTRCEDNARYGLRNRVITKTIKKSLRLRKQKNQNEDEVSDRRESKFKDIGNLQQEFSDITIDVPVMKKEVKDISSPEKITEEEENVPPDQGIQSCPAKSVNRSRRKLFTPQVEPLDEFLGNTGDSNERIRVPRPSYHRGKARRKL